MSIDVSKAVGYALIVEPDGARVSKAVGYAVLVSPPAEIRISKALGYALLVPSTSEWLTATLDTTTAPATLTLAPVESEVEALAPGTYTATVPITSTAEGVTNSPLEIVVTLTVT